MNVVKESALDNSDKRRFSVLRKRIDVDTLIILAYYKRIHDAEVLAKTWRDQKKK
jgi:hypothetical protein